MVETISQWLLETGDEEQKLLSESCSSISNALTHFTSCGTGCLEKPALPSLYHVARITALAYTKHYSLQLIPLTLKTQACTYPGQAAEKASVWEDYGYWSDAQRFLVKIFHSEATAPLSLQCINICFISSVKVLLKFLGFCKAAMKQKWIVAVLDFTKLLKK